MIADGADDNPPFPIWLHVYVPDVDASYRRALDAGGLPVDEPKRYHRVLSRAVWSSREASHVLLGLLVEAFVPEGPLVLGVDETLERRRSKTITAKGIYRD